MEPGAGDETARTGAPPPPDAAADAAPAPGAGAAAETTPPAADAPDAGAFDAGAPTDAAPASQVVATGAPITDVASEDRATDGPAGADPTARAPAGEGLATPDGASLASGRPPAAPALEPDAAPGASPGADAPARAAGPGDDVAAQAPGPGDAADPAGGRAARARGCALLAATGALLLVLGPWLLGQTVLPLVLRRVLAAPDRPAEVGRATLGWTDGVHVERLHAPAGGGRPDVLLEALTVDVGPARAAWAALTGATLPVRVVVRGLRVEADGAAPGAAAGPEPEPEPEPPAAPQTEGPAAPLELPCPLEARVQVEDVDVFLRAAPDPAEGGLLVELRGLSVDAHLRVERDASARALAPATVALRELRVTPERPRVLTTPLVVRRPRVELAALETPAPGGPVEALRLRLVVSLAGLEVEGVVIEDATLELGVEAAVATLGLGGVVRDGRATLSGTVDLSALGAAAPAGAGAGPGPTAGAGAPAGARPAAAHAETRLPAKLRLVLDDVRLAGALARAAPFVAPLLHGTVAVDPAGRAHCPGLPPFGLEAEGGLDVVLTPEGAPRLDELLRSITARGAARIGPGRLGPSKVVDGYAAALAGLGVSGLLEGVLPTDLSFDGVHAPFAVAAGRIRFEKGRVGSRSLALSIGGEVDFGGAYELRIGPADDEAPATDVTTASPGAQVRAVLRAVDAAGGVRLRGDLTTDAPCALVLPSAEALGAAALKLDLGDLLRQRGTLGADLDDALRGLGR